MYAVNGPTSSVIPVQGLTIDPESEAVIDHWAPEEVILIVFIHYRFKILHV